MTESSSVSPSPAWNPYVPSAAMPWDLRRVVHLHRRAGFAASWPELERDLHAGPDAAITRLFKSSVSSEFDEKFAAIGLAAVKSDNVSRVKACWLSRMLATPHPLTERLTLMWHNHFATSNRKVNSLLLMQEQNQLLRKYASRPFGELLTAIVKHPAILVWLDADANRSGRSNENLARELMELFTLGVGQYSEDDVKEVARALTGWSVINDQFAFVDSRHDDGVKHLLGREGKLDGDDVLQILLTHPATARRIAWRLTRTFLGENVPSAAIEQLAEGLRGRRLDIRWAVETIIRSELFFANEQLGTHVLGPAEFVVGSIRALELSSPAPDPMQLADWTSRIGQDLFYPPNVGGWKEGRSWLASNMVIARANFASALTSGRLFSSPRRESLHDLCQKYARTSDLEESVAWFARLLWGTAEPATVIEIVKSARMANGADPLPSAVALLLSSATNYQS